MSTSVTFILSLFFVDSLLTNLLLCGLGAIKIKSYYLLFIYFSPASYSTWIWSIMKKKCLLFMTFWTVFVVLLGVYWYLQLLQHDQHTQPNIAAREQSSINNGLSSFAFLDSMKKYCNIPTLNNFNGLEGNFEEEYDLLGVITIFRHGDRGPLVTVNDKIEINCSRYVTERYKQLENYVRTYKSDLLVVKLLPKSDFCIPGLLSKQGASQLIELGNGFKESYAKYFDFSDSNAVKHVSASTTPYSRTIQSVYSFLFGLVGSKTFLNINLQKKSDVNFCFKNCRCEAASRFEKSHKLELNNLFENDLSLTNFSSQVQMILKNSGKSKKSILPSTLKDMVLHYACHDQIPDCSIKESICLNSTTMPLDYYLKREAEASASGLNLKKAAILRAYGLLNNIDQQILSWINMSKKRKSKTLLNLPSFHFFSGHDLTLMYILASLHIYDGFLPHFASRLTFEILLKGSQYYLRILWNGLDVTKKICPPSPTYCNARILVNFLHIEMKRYFQTEKFSEACEV